MKTIHMIKINTKLEEGAIVYSLRGHDRMVAGFITTHAISVYHHKRCEFEPCSGEVYSIQHYVIKFVSDLRQVGLHYNITISSHMDVREILKFPSEIKKKRIPPSKIKMFNSLFDLTVPASSQSKISMNMIHLTIKKQIPPF